MKGSKYVISIALLVAMLMCMWVMMWSWLPTGNNDKKVSADTLRVVVYDTIPYYMPVPKDSTVIRYVTQRLPTAYDKEDNFPNKVSENIPDSADVVIPITQKVYEDSTYTAYVSGYCARLDSLIMYPRHEEITVYRKPKRWHVGIQVGYGMTLKGTPQFAPYVGIGVSYNLFSF